MGAYDLLLDWCYANEKALPGRTSDVYRIGRCMTKAERDNVDRVLADFFDHSDEGYTQKRVLAEIAKAGVQADTNRLIAEERESKKRAQKEARMEHEACTNRSTNDQPSQTPERAEAKLNTLSASADDVSAKAGKPGAKTLTAPIAEAIVAAYHENLPMMPAVRKMSEPRKRKLKARWYEDAQHQSIEYWTGFFAYVAESDFLTGRDGRWDSCDFEWLIGSENHLKVTEGKYEPKARAA